MYKRFILMTAPVLAIATAGGAVAATNSTEPVGSNTVASTNPVPLAPEETAAPAPIVAVEPAATAALPVLKQLPATAMPADVAAQVGSSKRFGRNPNLARAITTATGQGWVVPGRGFVCLAVPDGSYGWASVCTTTADAAANGIQVTLGGNDSTGRVAVTTLAPTGKTVVSKTAAGVAALSARAAGVSSVAANANGVSSAFVSPDTTVAVAAQ